MPVSVLVQEPALGNATKEVDAEDAGLGPQGKPLTRERVVLAGAGTVAVTEVDASTIDDVTRNVPLLAANPTRRSVKIENQSELVLLVREGSAAKVARYSYRVEAGQVVEISYPASTLAIYGLFLGGLPSQPVLITERS